MQPPIFLSGRVVTEDGQPPPEPARIERVCNGNPHGEGFTDSQGYFSIQLGNASGSVVYDASENSGFSTMGMSGTSGASGPSGMSGIGNQQQSSNLGSGGAMMDRWLENCDLQARVGGYRSQTVSLAGRRPMDNPDIGVILLHRLGPNESGTVVSASSLAAPKDARKAYDKGLESARKGKPDEALKSFEKAVAVYPGYAIAWCELGRIQVARSQIDSARESFDRASKADPKYVEPYLQLSLLAMRQQKWVELADLSDKAGKLDSFDYPQLFFFNAVANYSLHNLDTAEKSIQQAEHLDTRHQYPQIAHLHGVILIQRQDYPAAAERLRAYLKLAPNANDGDRVRAQLVEIEKVTAQNPAGPAKPDSQQ
jgi:tetratricopeptide (TPR) repeat protein